MMSNINHIDPAEIRRALAVLIEPGSVFEVRIPHADRLGTLSGYFDNQEKCIQAVCKWSGKVPAVYITLNPCKPALLARAVNRLAPQAKQTTADHDILRRRWLPIDFDPVRPAGISSTDAEHDAALRRAVACRDWLTAQDWPAPIYAESGNGAHLLYRIDLPNDDASRDLVKQCLETLALYHADDVVSLDVGVFNAARIWKLYGTRACKGEHLPERPHRLARLIDVPDMVLVVSRQQLDALAALVPSSPQSEPARSPGRTPFDLDRWIAEHHLPVVRTGAWGNGGQKWVLNPCPWNNDHTNNAAYIVQCANGAIAAGCHHNSCAGKDWHALRDLCEPEWRTVRSESSHSSKSSRGVSSAARGESAQKAPPNPLRRPLPPAEPYPIDALGSILAPMARCLCTVVQAPDALCGQAVLAAAALAVQAHGMLAMDGRKYPLSAFFVTVAESGERKTTADNYALWPHMQWERQQVEQFSRMRDTYANAREAYQRARDEALRSAEGRSAKQQALAELGPPPSVPLEPIFLTADPTYEGLVKLLAVGLPSVGLFSNEGGRFIGGNALNADNQLKTAAGLSDLWDGKPIDRVRAGDGAVKPYGRRVSMHLMLQPKVARLFLGSPQLFDQGLLSRCLVAQPESTIGTRTYKAFDVTLDPDVQKYNNHVKTILEHAWPLNPDSENELDPPLITVSAESKRLWVQFHDHVEVQMRPEGPLAPIRGFASKTAEHALRLATVLTLVDALDTREIPKVCMEAGIALAQFYLKEALRLFHTAETPLDLEQAEMLLGWIHQHALKHVYLRQVYQYGPHTVRDAATAKRVIGILADHGWLTKVPGMVIDNAYRKDVWEVYCEPV
jgi:hypothetical protein